MTKCLASNCGQSGTKKLHKKMNTLLIYNANVILPLTLRLRYKTAINISIISFVSRCVRHDRSTTV